MGSYSTKELHLLPYHRHIVKMAKEFEDIAFQYILRNRHDFTDALATLASLIHLSKDKIIPIIDFVVQNALVYRNYAGKVSDEMT